MHLFCPPGKSIFYQKKTEIIRDWSGPDLLSWCLPMLKQNPCSIYHLFFPQSPELLLITDWPSLIVDKMVVPKARNLCWFRIQCCRWCKNLVSTYSLLFSGSKNHWHTETIWIRKVISWYQGWDWRIHLNANLFILYIEGYKRWFQNESDGNGF